MNWHELDQITNLIDLRCAAACKSLKRLRSCTHDIECTIVSGLAFIMALFLSTNEISLAQWCLRARCLLKGHKLVCADDKTSSVANGSFRDISWKSREAAVKAKEAVKRTYVSAI